MIKWTAERFLPPAFVNEDKREYARLLTIICLGLFVVAGLLSIVLFVLAQTGIILAVHSFTWLLLGSTFYYLFILLLVHRGRLRLAALLITGQIYLVVTFIVFVNGGLYSGAIIGYFVLIAVASLLFSGEGVTGSAFFSFLALSGALYADLRGIIASGNPPVVIIYRFVAISLVIGLTAVVLRQAMVRLRHALDHAQRENVERKRVEEQIRLQAKELARSNAELQQFAYVASHDLQEPLRMVTSFLQLLQRRYAGQLDQEADEFINYAVDGANRMKLLINSLLAYSRLGRQDTQFEPTDCTAVLQQTVHNLQLAIEESDAMITCDPLPTIMADGKQWSQLFQNLISNAIKFRGAHPPRIHVSARQEEDAWLFSVQDNGIGIDPQHADRVFAIFQRLHSVTDYPGAGIGLAICKRIIERHNGRIWFESQPGHGATFFFSIPIEPATQLTAWKEQNNERTNNGTTS